MRGISCAILDSYVQIHYPGVKKALLTPSAAFTGSIDRLNTSGFIQVQLPTCMSASVLTIAMHLPEVMAYAAHASQLHGQCAWPAYIATLVFLGLSCAKAPQTPSVQVYLVYSLAAVQKCTLQTELLVAVKHSQL